MIIYVVSAAYHDGSSHILVQAFESMKLAKGFVKRIAPITERLLTVHKVTIEGSAGDM
jgi:hypothetical protein